jgi:DNA-directed RNA polymerase subunit RPC12/RpoP
MNAKEMSLKGIPEKMRDDSYHTDICDEEYLEVWECTNSFCGHIWEEDESFRPEVCPECGSSLIVKLDENDDEVVAYGLGDLIGKRMEIL